MQLFLGTCIFLIFISIKRIFSEEEDLINDYSPLYEDDPLLSSILKSDGYHVQLYKQLEWIEHENLRQNYIDNYYYLATILDDYNDLYRYCEVKLKEACISIEDVNKRFQEICRNPKASCKDAYYKITKKAKEIATSFSNKETNKRDQCSKLQVKCFFLEHHGSRYIGTKCATLKEYCYNKVRMGVTEVIVYDFLRGTSNDLKTCTRKLQNECQLINQRSPELFDLCVNVDTVCNKFISKSKEECQSSQALFPLKQISEEKCKTLLEKCYSILSECPALHSQCRSLKMDCAEKGFFYDISENYNFNLLENPSTHMNKNGVEYAYGKLYNSGIHVTKIQNLSDLLIANFLTNKTTGADRYCKKVLGEKCSSINYLSYIKPMCTASSNSEYKICKRIDCETENYSYSLLKKFEESNQFLKYSDRPLSKTECEEYLSICYFIGKYFHYWTNYDTCKYVRVVCYQEDLDAATNMILIKKLSGKLKLKRDDQGIMALYQAMRDCKNALLEECGDFMYHSYSILYKCLRPKETCRNLTDLLDKNSERLDENLKAAILNPEYTTCRNLKEECNELGSYFGYTLMLCKIFKKMCENVDKLIEFKLNTLKEKNSVLKNNVTCLNYLDNYCSENVSSHICTNKNKSCTQMLDQISTHCEQLPFYLSYYKSSNGQITHINYGRCSQFLSYCGMLKEICPNLSNICSQVEQSCNKISTEKKNIISLIKVVGEEISNHSKCEKKLREVCRNTTMKEKMNELCTKVNDTCKILELHLKKICDQLTLKIFKFLFTNSKSEIECQKLTPLCSSIASSCNETNVKILPLCHNFTSVCKLLEPPKPPAPPAPSEPSESPETPETPSEPVPKPPEPETPPEPPAPETPSEPAPKPPEPPAPETPSEPAPKPPESSTPETPSEPPESPELPEPKPTLTNSTAILTSTQLLTICLPTTSATHSSATHSSVTRSSTTRSTTRSLRPKPTTSSDDRHTIGFGIRSRKLRGTELIWMVAGTILGMWIIV
ncbi:uncharacterized protein T551_03739 [Pneumocystis jirovecii RU7]|uniref:Major surface glycoprotein 2 C-terminal domain-containing protein n=1 Tax=Pneumocystis jirovecii (strain RU7) TaxID=1408657 RepID=A0A0W4ZAI4_PNEJ7|nr:uncharacterized protein T551_03739 [Pneumocystis jirovecii RU7]KTW25472.1 hypothetical protein T551_03739 [Pneumocystis jirovecii RU7]